ncbi:MAG: rhodanese-like domain-containing protein [Patescibacteria group bacterium]
MKFSQKNKTNHTLIFLFAITLIIVLIIVYFFQNKSSKENNNYLELNSKKESARENGSKSEGGEVLLTMPEEAAEAIRSKKHTLLDIRPSEEFKMTHIESSQNLPYQKDFQDFSNFNKDKLFIIIEEAPSQKGIEIAQKMIKEGFEVRCLEGGLKRYLREGYPVISHGNINSTTDRAKTNQISKQEILKKLQKEEKVNFLDVRHQENYQKSHVKNSTNIPLEDLEERKSDVPTVQIIILDENPERSFKAAVRLFDMNILNTFYYPENLQNLKEESNKESPESAEFKGDKNTGSE